MPHLKICDVFIYTVIQGKRIQESLNNWLDTCKNTCNFSEKLDEYVKRYEGTVQFRSQ